MSELAAIVEAGELVAAHGPWPRAVVDTALWLRAIERLADGTLALLSVWGEPGVAHMAVLGACEPRIAVLTIICE